MQNKVYTNRYGDKFTFTETEDGDILWEGTFEYSRYGFPNVYDKAYSTYCTEADTDERLTLGEFKKAVHEYSKETYEPTPLAKRYAPLVYSDTSIINMVDPSGGPYLTAGQEADFIISGMKGKISHFESIETGYKIVIK